MARSVAGVIDIAKRLKEKGAAILILDPHLSNATPGEELVFNVLASVAQFERQIMLERQREGIAKAKGEGKYKGRKATAREHADEIRALHAANLKAPEIAAKLGISERSVYRVLAGTAKILKKAA